MPYMFQRWAPPCTNCTPDLVCPWHSEVETLRRAEVARLASQAVQVQNACNLSGVLTSAAAAANSLRDCGSPRGLSTLEISHHPVMMLFASKIADLAGLSHTYPTQAETDCLALVARGAK